MEVRVETPYSPSWWTASDIREYGLNYGHHVQALPFRKISTLRRSLPSASWILRDNGVTRADIAA